MRKKVIGEYEIHEPTVGVMMPLMSIMNEDSSKFQLELAKACIYKNGKPIGDALLDMGMKDYMKLILEVMAISGLSGDDEKND
jgi:hypothetical protein